MPRLPAALEPAFPLVKRAHRMATRRTGALTRRLAHRYSGPRALPVRGTSRSVDTVAAEPDAVRIHTSGPATSLSRPAPIGTPPGHWYFESLRDVDLGARFTLEIDHGRVVGNYAAHLTPGGLLDFETSHYFGVHGWHEHPLYLRPRLPRMEHVSGDLLSLATRGTGVNYYHVLMDLVERYAIFTESMPGAHPDAVLVNRNTRFAREYLTLLGLDEVPCIEATKHVALQADRLWAPSLPNAENLAPPQTTAWIRENLRPRRTQGLPKRIYVTRGDRRNSRRVVNEQALLRLLTPLGFEVFDPGQHSVADQIDQFAAAEVVVGPHGAGLTNLVFAPVGVRVLELFAPRYLNPGYWTITANIAESKYRYLVGLPDDPRPPGAPMQNVYDDITVDPDVFADMVTELLAG
ncbi:glycosyltransferase family 61 protein [Nocardioides limicola]|uniref:glycosyltransferase family 61 protein n=1 Tax=Nocardioides limicola TaxID=2803368 RepID=UPI00193BC678|nr:glycosyltransferase family 61 protein [Nocardioides sp. DJM-14]